MRVIRVRSLSPKDLAIWVDEAARLVSNGADVRSLSKTLKWDEADVLDLLRTQEFKDRLDKFDPDAYAALMLKDGSLVSAGEAIAYVNARTQVYVEALDELARKANSEQVRLTALMRLLSMTAVANESMTHDVFTISEADAKRFRETLEQVLGGRE